MRTHIKYYITLLLIYSITAVSAFLYQLNALRLTAKSFPSFVDPQQLNTDFNRGFTTLVNCNYFIKVYPKFRKELLKHTEVFFAYSDNPMMKDYYAITVSTENTIFLSDNYFAVNDNNQREGILAHEMLHIIGMPKHKKAIMEMEDRYTDAVYTVEHYCFNPKGVWGTKS